MDREALEAAAKRGDWLEYFAILRRDRYDAARAKAEIVAPPPEHTSRDPWPDGFKLPGGAASLKKLAKAHGWIVRETYSKGSVVTRKKELGTVVESRHSVAISGYLPGGDLRLAVAWEAVTEAEKLAWKIITASAWRSGGGRVADGVDAIKKLVKGEASE